MKRLTVSLGVLIALMILSACGGGAADVPDTVELTIEMNEFDYVPEEIELWVGQEVTLNFVNMGEKDHEFMVGRDVNFDAGYANGFHEEFFAANPVIVEGMAMRDGAMLMGMDEGMDMGDEEMDMGDEEMPMEDEEMDMGDEEMPMEDEHDDMEGMDEHGDDHLGFMVMVPLDTNTATITFTVTEDMVGNWTFACFEDEGQHFEDGMEGTLTVHDR